MYVYLINFYHTAFLTVHSWLGKRKMWHSCSLVEHHTDSRHGVWPVSFGKPDIETRSKARVIAKIQLFLHPRERILSKHKADAATGWGISIYRTKQFSHPIVGNSKHIQLLTLPPIACNCQWISEKGYCPMHVASRWQMWQISICRDW
jgi:hypothetical protein